MLKRQAILGQEKEGETSDRKMQGVGECQQETAWYSKNCLERVATNVPKLGASIVPKLQTRNLQVPARVQATHKENHMQSCEGTWEKPSKKTP